MRKRNTELVAGALFTAAAIAFAVVVVQYDRESDASAQLVPVEADFSVSSVRHDVAVQHKDGTTSTGDHVQVDAVYRYQGVTYRHSLPQEDVMGVVSSLPGHAKILIDPKNPSKRPHITPVSIEAAPLLGCVFSALIAAFFFVSAFRNRRS